MRMRKAKRKPVGERKTEGRRKPRQQSDPQAVFRRFIRMLEKLEACGKYPKTQEQR